MIGCLHESTNIPGGSKWFFGFHVSAAFPEASDLQTAKKIIRVMCWKKLEDGQRSEVLKLFLKNGWWFRKLQVNQLIYHVQSLGYLPYQLVDFFICLPSKVYICMCHVKNLFFLHVSSGKNGDESPTRIFRCQFLQAPWRFQPGPLLCKGVENSMIGWEP